MGKRLAPPEATRQIGKKTRNNKKIINKNLSQFQTHQSKYK